MLYIEKSGKTLKVDNKNFKNLKNSNCENNYYSKALINQKKYQINLSLLSIIPIYDIKNCKNV